MISTLADDSGTQTEVEKATEQPPVEVGQKIARDSSDSLDQSLGLDSSCYLNRELSWIKFNRRVLREAADPCIPLLERVKFLAIVSANIDEFTMKRLGGLKLQIAAGVTKVTIDGRTPETQLKQCRLMLLSLQQEKEAIYHSVLEELGQHDIKICAVSELATAEQQALEEYFQLHVEPMISPLVIDSHHPFPFISNLSMNLILAMKHPEYSGVLQARINIPTGDDVPRFVQVGRRHTFVLLEDLIAHHIESFFPGAAIIACELFRITRNAITGNDTTGMEDMLEIIASELSRRRFAPVVRLQTGPSMYPPLKSTLITHLSLHEEQDVFESAAMLCMSDLMEIASLDIPELHDPPHEPVDNIKVDVGLSVFDAIKSVGSILLKHPYESFSTSVERYVLEASRDPQVVAIKMTLYRTSADTTIVEHLVNAARVGKQVAVVVELKARFDEEANILWATRLEQCGVHVSYGVRGLKTHCKAILVVRREQNGLRRYAHISTGNYHAGTARMYSDIGLLTCDDQLTGDLAVLFNYLTTDCKSLSKYTRILATPSVIKAALLEKIRREISVHSGQDPGLIRFKTNALEDKDIIDALYEASGAGVKVELIVRDICRLRPGVAGLSENISVISVVGRFLEHSRVYYFRNGEEEEYYIGSADLMTRNLERRVELLIPIDSLYARSELHDLLEDQLNDNFCAWDMQSDGTYLQRRSAGLTPRLNCQDAAISSAQQHNGRLARSHFSEPRRMANKWLRLCF